MGKELQMAITWWKESLKIELPHERDLANKMVKVNMFCDAASNPPKIAAILFTNGKPIFTKLDVDKAMLRKFEPRKDNSIMGLEILSVLLGVSIISL